MLHTSTKNTFVTGPKGKMFGSSHSIYLGLKVLLLILGYGIGYLYNNKEWSVNQRFPKFLFD